MHKRIKNSFFIREKKYIITVAITLIFIVVCALFFPFYIIRAENKYYTAQAQNIYSIIKSNIHTYHDTIVKIASSPSLIEAIKEKDSNKILPILSELKDTYHLPAVTITDENGFVLSRTKSATKIGDNIFLSLPQGRAVARGEDVESIETSSISFLGLSASHPIKENGVLIGGIFGGLSVDTPYAESLKTELHDKADIVFYTKKDGVIADSFQEPEVTKLLNQYFSPQSDWVVNGTQNAIIKFPNGNQYYIENITFPGLEQSPGGMILFFPLHPLTLYLFITINSLVIFIIVLLIIHFLIHNSHQHNHYILIHYVVCGIIIIISAYFITLFSYNRYVIHLEKPSFTIYNSTLGFSPSTGVASVDVDQRIDIKVNSGGESLNGFNVMLTFDPSLISVSDIDTSKSACPENFFLEKTIDNAKGSVTISCIIPSPGFDQKTGLVATLTLTHKMPGTVILAFDPGSQVLANDGLGTNVLRYSENGSYQVVSNSDTPVSLYSPSHPNTETWYQGENVQFSWVPCPLCTYDAFLTTSSSTNNKIGTTTTSTTFSSMADGSGIYYFHLITLDNGKSSEQIQKVLIDTIPPSPPTIEASSNTVSKGEIVRFRLNGEDYESGLQKNFYIKYDNGIFLPVGKEVYSSFDTSGDHSIVVRIYDLAGNYSESTSIIHVK